MMHDACSGFPQSVLGALIAVNLKNTLLQLSDPYYLWKKSKLDCVSQSCGRNIVLLCFPYLILFYCLSPPVCVGSVVFGHILSEPALWSGYRRGIFHTGSNIQDTVVSEMLLKPYNKTVARNINGMLY